MVTTTTAPTIPDRECNAYLRTSVLDSFSLKDHVTVVTGGARGIGLSFAVACAEVGSHIAVLDRSEEPHPDFYVLQKEYGVKVKFYQTDVTDYSVLEKTFQDVVDDFGRLDGLITSAGICPDEPFTSRSPASIKVCFDINVLGTYFAAQIFTKHVDALNAARVSKDPNLTSTPSETSTPAVPATPPKGASIVMVGSICAYMTSKGQYLSDYCASKGAIVALVRALGTELAERGIRVNSISPGYTATDMTLSIADTRPALMNTFLTEPPMKRMGDRTDLKGAAVYLLSGASAYTTGSDLLITGGLHAGRV